MLPYRPVLLVILLIPSLVASSQVITDYSQIKASQISDAQLKQYMQQAAASGLTEQQMESELLRRGLPPSELAELRLRIQQIRDQMPGAATDTADAIDPSSAGKRTYKKPSLQNEPLLAVKKVNRLFGSELFSNSNLSFEPDLRMATPKDYVIGPDDQLILNIYGVNMS
ncbi:MAG: hypothetical protein ACTHLE_27070, partial [Agriterribacter sp.]